jgi:hypothetical protein
MEEIDWHSAPLSRNTAISKSYINTQNVRRFFLAECGDHIKFDRPFMAWIKNSTPKTLGDAADEWLRRQAEA